MSMRTQHEECHEDIVAFAWKALGLCLALAAFFLLGITGLVYGDDPAGPIVQGAAAFLVLWGLNRALAHLLGLHTAPRPRPIAPPSKAKTAKNQE